MKRYFLAILAVTGLLLTSCEKCRECSCESTTVYEFEEGFDESVESSIRSGYDKEFAEDYPDSEEEICEKRGKFDDAKAAYESKSIVIFEDDNVQGYDWSVNFNRSCYCED
ncbi:MAG: hypothetical protein RLP15_10370 [Cryomorphaceae bacterium]